MRDPFIDVVFESRVPIDMTLEPGDPLGEFTERMLYGDLIGTSYELRSEARLKNAAETIRQWFGEYAGEAFDLVEKMLDNERVAVIRELEGKSAGTTETEMQITKQIVEHMHEHHKHASLHHLKMSKMHEEVAAHHEEEGNEVLASKHTKLAKLHEAHSDHHKECAEKCAGMGKAVADELNKNLEPTDASAVNRYPEASIADRFKRQAVPRTGAPDKVDMADVPQEMRHLVES